MAAQRQLAYWRQIVQAHAQAATAAAASPGQAPAPAPAAAPSMPPFKPQAVWQHRVAQSHATTNGFHYASSEHGTSSPDVAPTCTRASTIGQESVRHGFLISGRRQPLDVEDGPEPNPQMSAILDPMTRPYHVAYTLGSSLQRRASGATQLTLPESSNSWRMQILNVEHSENNSNKLKPRMQSAAAPRKPAHWLSKGLLTNCCKSQHATTTILHFIPAEHCSPDCYSSPAVWFPSTTHRSCKQRC